LAITSSTKFFLGLLLVCILSLLFINPSSVKLGSTKDGFEFAFYDFEAMNITQNGLDTILKSANAIKYKDYTIFDNPTLVKKNKDDKLQMIESIYAKYSPNEYIYMRGDITYIRDDGIELKTDALDYDIISQLVTTNSLYQLNIKDNVVFGNGFEYNMNTKELVSYDIKANMKHK
jgi:LPS export ABC transporter protein LptC